MFQNGYTSVVTIAPEYAFGWETVGGVAQPYTAAGCNILAQLWPPLGTSNFGPYLSFASAPPRRRPA